MDPNEALRLVRELAHKILGASGDEHAPDFVADAELLAEAATALDGWMSGGGFMPEEWAKRLPRCRGTGTTSFGDRFRCELKLGHPGGCGEKPARVIELDGLDQENWMRTGGKK